MMQMETVPERVAFVAEQQKRLIPPPMPTGRRLVIFHDGVSPEKAAALLRQASDSAVVSVAEEASFGAAIRSASAADSIVVLNRFPVAAIGGGMQRATALATALQAHAEVADSRPEFWLFAIDGPPWIDDAASTWGMKAIGADASTFDGSGIKLAVLDTGIDLGHPRSDRPLDRDRKLRRR